MVFSPCYRSFRRYKRYKLGDVKDFDSLFFPEKANLLRILDHFENKTGESVSS